MKIGDLVKIKISDDIYKPNTLEDKIGVLIKRSIPRSLEEIITKNERRLLDGGLIKGQDSHEPAWHVLVEDACIILGENDLRMIS